jgi:hypothetical protein
VILELRREIAEPKVTFDSRSGELAVAWENDLYVLDFPARPAVECGEDAALVEALGARPVAFLRSTNFLCVFESEAQVRALAPDMARLAR